MNIWVNIFTKKSSSNLFILILWIVATSLLIYELLAWLPATIPYGGGEYVPVGPDSFYHARRILDVASGSPLLQFDPFMHAPEGSWVTWPWAFDLLHGYIVSAIGALSPGTPPINLLAWIPPFWGVLNLGLFIVIAARLGLSLLFVSVAGISYAISPLTELLHAPGMIDHHYAEQTFTFLAILTGMLWAKDYKPLFGVFLGLVLGISQAFQNGMFILQAPLLAFVFVLWWRKIHIQIKDILPVAISLFASTLLILVPSDPFWQSLNHYYLLSAFHGYAACCSVVMLLFLSTFRRNRNSLIFLFIVGGTAIFFMASNIYSGLEYLSVDMPFQYYIGEVRTPFAWSDELRMPWLEAIKKYGAQILLLPLILVLSLYRVKASCKTGDIYFWVFSALFGCLLLSQFRMHAYGSFVLILPLLLWAQNLKSTTIKLILAVSMVLAYSPKLIEQSKNPPLSLDSAYAAVHPVMPLIAEICDKDPGIILADATDGHFLRYHTRCSVISNMFLINEEHVRKVLLTERLLNSGPGEIVKESIADYVFVRRWNNPDVNWRDDILREDHEALVYSLLFQSPTSEYELLVGLDQRRSGDNGTSPVARFYRIRK